MKFCALLILQGKAITPTMNQPVIRKLITATLFIQLVGIGVELILLEHYEDFWQIVPLVLIGTGFITSIISIFYSSTFINSAFLATMALIIISGFVGSWQHFSANLEFEQEMYPSLAGIELWWEALKGATPALAPGSMIGIGLIGIIYIRYQSNQTDN